MNKILYLCDGKACVKCSPECIHTADITHAENFRRGLDGTYWEKLRATKEEVQELLEKIKGEEQCQNK